ncbi:hypothetical protein [Alkalimonas sp.]|uniref:hypothetical protein n=1 Tax=Alkalimonas sp. TaxID=1872453 RepID=UPI00263B5939|nr:hypothetical protein [Alkalimonas sp.]MCC5825907.1 hypothetical protein [Alkalimonas sp.]
METIELTWGRASRIWWAFFWRATLIGAVIGLILGFAGGVIGLIIGQAELAIQLATLASYLVAVPVSLLCLREALQLKYKGYRICLVKHDEVVESVGLAEQDTAR